MFSRSSRILTSFSLVASISLCNASFLANADEAARPQFMTSSGGNTVQLNKTTKLTLTGEVGEAVASYSTMTPDICSVSADGEVTGLIGGTCLIQASITGSNNYLVTAPTVIVLSVEGATAPTAYASSSTSKLRNRISVIRENGFFIFTLDLEEKYQNHNVLLQLGIKRSNGVITYRGVSSILLNSNSEATVTRRATYAKNLYLRALVGKRIVLTKKII